MNKRLIRSFYLFFMTVFCLFIFSRAVKADDSETVFLNLEQTKVTKNLSHAAMTLTKKEGHTAITIQTKNGSVYNGRMTLYSPVLIYQNNELFYTRYNKKTTEIVQVNSETTEEKVIKRLDKKYYPDASEDPNIILEYATDNYIFYSLVDLKSDYKLGFPTFNVYRLNLQNQKTNLVAKHADRLKFSKDRMLYFEHSYDFGPMTLYSVKHNGEALKKSKYKILNYELIGNKLYFVGSQKDSGPYYVFRSNTDFGNNEILSNKIKTKPMENLTIAKITDKKVYYLSFDYSKGEADHYYEIDLKTKNTRKVKGDVWDLLN